MRNAAPSIFLDPISCSATLLALIALLLLWRHYRLRAQLADMAAAVQRERRRADQADQALAGSRCQLAQLQASQQTLREAERRRIARDLHDDLGQHLLSLNCDICTLAARHPAFQEPAALIETHIKLTMRSLRDIVRDLRPEALESGLQRAMQQQVEQFSRLSGIPCRLDADPAACAAAPLAAIDAALYRILQESLSNITRHAQASRVEVALRLQGIQLELAVRDNGIGLPHASARRGCGLRGIAERVAEAGGQMHIASTQGQGTVLTMRFPLHADTASPPAPSGPTASAAAAVVAAAAAPAIPAVVPAATPFASAVTPE